MGTGTFCDDMFSALDESFLATWDVEIEESETTPGYYRLVNPFGKLADGKITFPDNKMYYLQIAFANYLEGVPMNGNTHNKFLVTIPAQDGVDEITVDEQGTPEYYNMQGMRVDNPTPGCLYIRRTGSKVEKIIAR